MKRLDLQKCIVGSVFTNCYFLKNKETEEVVGKLTTDKDGVATSELLPIATYEDGKAIAPITYVLSETKPLASDV